LVVCAGLYLRSASRSDVSHAKNQANIACDKLEILGHQQTQELAQEAEDEWVAVNVNDFSYLYDRAGRVMDEHYVVMSSYGNDVLKPGKVPPNSFWRKIGQEYINGQQMWLVVPSRSPIQDPKGYAVPNWFDKSLGQSLRATGKPKLFATEQVVLKGKAQKAGTIDGVQETSGDYSFVVPAGPYLVFKTKVSVKKGQELDFETDFLEPINSDYPGDGAYRQVTDLGWVDDYGQPMTNIAFLRNRELICKNGAFMTLVCMVVDKKGVVQQVFDAHGQHEILADGTLAYGSNEPNEAGAAATNSGTYTTRVAFL
jgi:hypothetical protein